MSRLLAALALAAGALAGSSPAHSDEVGDVILGGLLGKADPLLASAVQVARHGCDNADRASLGKQIRYIHNSAYVWTVAVLEDGLCVFLKRPVRRLLSHEEAQRFMVATETEFEPGPLNRNDATDHSEAGGVPSHGSDDEFYIDLGSEDGGTGNKKR